jgi:hypothetical protein
MTLSDLASIGSLVSGVAVLASLIFVGFQLRQNTWQLMRSETNLTMQQASAWRLAIVSNHDLADIWVKGRSEAAAFDATDEARFDLLLEETLWMVFHIWDRSKRGLLDSGSWNKGSAEFLAGILLPRRSAAWWERYKINFPAEFSGEIEMAMRARRPVTI